MFVGGRIHAFLALTSVHSLCCVISRHVVAGIVHPWHKHCRIVRQETSDQTTAPMRRDKRDTHSVPNLENLIIKLLFPPFSSFFFLSPPDILNEKTSIQILFLPPTVHRLLSPNTVPRGSATSEHHPARIPLATLDPLGSRPA